jgi:hypothetical protein
MNFNTSTNEKSYQFTLAKCVKKGNAQNWLRHFLETLRSLGSFAYRFKNNMKNKRKFRIFATHTAETHYRKFEKNIPRKNVSLSGLSIPIIGLPMLLQENIWADPGNI